MLSAYYSIVETGRPVAQSAAPGGLAVEDDGPTPPDFSAYDDAELIQRGPTTGTARAFAKLDWLRRVG